MRQAADLVLALRGKGVKLWEEAGTLKVSAPKGALSPELHKEIANSKQLILDFLKESQDERRNAVNAIAPAVHSDHIPLSFAQRRLWYLCQMEGSEGVTYNMPAALLLTGHLQEQKLCDSLAYIVARHDVLRTTFGMRGGEPVQLVHKGLRIDAGIIDLVHLDDAQQQNELARLTHSEAVTPFDLEAGPLARFTIIRLSAERHVFLVTLHHIISDGWSIDVFIAELIDCYQMLTGGADDPQLPALPIQYADFAVWQQRWLAGNRLHQLLGYWKQKLAGIPPLLPLPCDRPRPAVQSFRGGLEKFAFSAQVSKGLKDLCAASAVTPFMTLMSVYAVVLSRWSGQDDIVIGSVIANRNRKELERLIGFFVNSLVFRIAVDRDVSFRELLRRVREQSIEAFDYQDLPFEKLVEELNPERTASYSPVFQVAFALQNTGNSELNLPGLEVVNLDTHSGTSKYDLTFFAAESINGIAGVVEYNSDIFDGATIRRFIGHFENALTFVSQWPDRKIADIDILSVAEKAQLRLFGGEVNERPANRTILSLFKEQVAAFPDAVALAGNGGRFSYRELDTLSDSVAAQLLARGIRRSERVGVMAGRSARQVIGMMAVLKAGGCYVPLDPAYPEKRLQFIASDAGVRLILTDDLSRTVVIAGCDAMQITTDAVADAAIGALPEVLPGDAAYMIYTSGSTGTPKGVLLAHCGLLNMVEQQINIFKVTPCSRVFQFASPGFDASVSEYFMALGCGASLVLSDLEALTPTPGFCTLLQQEGITHITLPPSFLALLPHERLPQLKSLIVAGEAVGLDLVRKWSAGRHFFNAYGPTESTVCTSVAELTPDSQTVTIGRPIGNIVVRILDNDGNACAVGVAGELYIGGAGVAIGYHDREALNAQKFVTLPSEDGQHGRYFRSGDRARFLASGEMEFLGRIDDQVKVRGFRIEPGEIEEVLRAHPVVGEAAVVVAGANAEDRRLCAHLSLAPDWEARLSGMGNDSAESEQVAHWLKIFEHSYNHSASEFEDATFNIMGWNSSYTGLPIPAADMKHWVDDTVQRILDGKPRRVLEIGSGSGLLLFRVAPHCEHYTGTDFSANAVDYLRKVAGARNLNNVTLHQGDAMDISASLTEQFDLIIINSVIQYFPDQKYLLTVIKNCLKLLVGGGRIFLGDVRQQSLNGIFQASIEVSKLILPADANSLQRRIISREEHEEELLVDPAFLMLLPQTLPGITSVKTLLKHGRYDNELSKFRYDAIIEKDGVPVSAVQHVINWPETKYTPGQVAERLRNNPGKPLLLQGVANRRLAADAWAHDHIFSAAGDIRPEELTLADHHRGIHPDDFTDLRGIIPFEVEVSCAVADPLTFDVLFTPVDSAEQYAFALPDWHLTGLTLQALTNNPIKGRFQQKLVPVLKTYLLQRLPDYMTPSSFSIVDALPVTPNGKVDRAALQKAAATTHGDLQGHAAPATETEKTLARIWQSLLGVSSVSVRQGFFDAGGHSLLAVQLINNINAAFQCGMTLVDLFQHPDIVSQAAFIAGAGARRAGKVLIRFSEEAEGAPLFVVPGIGGNILPAADFCRSFPRPVYGLQVAELGNEAFADGIVSIAKALVHEVRNIQAGGPYILCGHSLGGWIIYEMACQLKAVGETTDLLIMLDVAAPPADGGEFSGWSDADWLAGFASLTGAAVPDAAALHRLPEQERISVLIDRLETGNIIPKTLGQDGAARLLMQLKALLRTPYVPSDTVPEVPVSLFVASETSGYGGGYSAGAQPTDAMGGWNEYAHSVEIIPAEGNHFSMIKGANGASLAAAVQKAVNKIFKHKKEIEYA